MHVNPACVSTTGGPNTEYDIPGTTCWSHAGWRSACRSHLDSAIHRTPPPPLCGSVRPHSQAYLCIRTHVVPVSHTPPQRRVSPSTSTLSADATQSWSHTELCRRNPQTPSRAGPLSVAAIVILLVELITNLPDRRGADGPDIGHRPRASSSSFETTPSARAHAPVGDQCLQGPAALGHSLPGWAVQEFPPLPSDGDSPPRDVSGFGTFTEYIIIARLCHSELRLVIEGVCSYITN